MYRASALLALETGTDLSDAEALGTLAKSAEMRFDPSPAGNRLLLNGRDVTDAIRSPEVTRAASVVSVYPAVRKILGERQRALGRDGGVVMEGRDIGTKVFPDAEVKIFLDASLEQRGLRRFRDRESAAEMSLAAVAREMAERDRRDQERDLSPLVPAADAILLDSTSLATEQVVERIVALAEERSQKSGARSQKSERTKPL
jgi:cytidylate kinase